MKDEENLAMIVKFVKYLIDKDVLDKQYEEDSIYGLTIMLEKRRNRRIYRCGACS